MNTDGIFAANSIVYPLVALLISLVIIKRVKDDLRPVVAGVVGSLAAQSSRYAVVWTLALLSATLASLQAMQEVATAEGWHYLAAGCKILQPGLTVIVTLAKATTAKEDVKKTPTNPPFPAPNP